MAWMSSLAQKGKRPVAFQRRGFLTDSFHLTQKFECGGMYVLLMGRRRHIYKNAAVCAQSWTYPMRSIASWLACSVAVALSACGGGGGDPPAMPMPAPNPQPQTI